MSGKADAISNTKAFRLLPKGIFERAMASQHQNSLFVELGEGGKQILQAFDFHKPTSVQDHLLFGADSQATPRRRLTQPQLSSKTPQRALWTK